MNGPTLQERQRQVREDAILEAAHELLGEQGYAAMSMDELAARVGVSKATLYQHFASKEELAINVIVQVMRFNENLLTSAPAGLAAVTRLEQALQRGIERRAGLWALQMPLMPQNVLQHPRFVEQRRRLDAAYTSLIDQAKHEGDLTATLPTPVIVRAFTGLFRLDVHDLCATCGLTPTEVSDHLVNLVFNGMRATTQPTRGDVPPVTQEIV